MRLTAFFHGSVSPVRTANKALFSFEDKALLFERIGKRPVMLFPPGNTADKHYSLDDCRIALKVA